MATIIKLKRGTSTPTTSDLANGEVGIDTSAKKFYINDSGTIKEIGGSTGDATSPLAGDVRGYTGDGSTTAYTVSSGADVENVLVFVNGVYQRPTTDYTVSGTTITFVTAPASADAITIKELVEGANALNDTGLVRGYTGDGSTTGFTVTSGKTAEEFLVFLNGVYQRPTNEYTVSSGTLTFSTAPVSADVITIKELAEGTGSEILTIADDTSTTTSFNAGDTLTIAGGTNITTSISGDTITINGSSTDLVSDTSPQLGGNLDLNSSDITGTGNINITGTLDLTSTDAGSAAAPELTLYRNSASPADADYIGQLKFSGENDAGGKKVFAKITGKIGDASSGTEDGIIEIAHIKAGSQNISARFTSDTLKLINSTKLEVAGLTYPTSDGSANQVIKTDGSGNLSFGDGGGNAFSTINLNDSTNVVADSSSDTLNLDSSGLISITGDASTDTVTVSTVTSATIPFTKANGDSSDIDLQTQGSLGDVITNLYIPFINASGGSVTTLVVGSS